MKKEYMGWVIGLITTIVGVMLTWYLSVIYFQPKIIYYGRPYYKIGDTAIGNIYLWNSGKRPDHNISITLDSVISENDIKIVDLSSSYEIKNIDNKTIITIHELKPEEAADITFKDDFRRDDFEILDFVSEHSNIVNIPFAQLPKWWQFTPVYLFFFGLISAIMGFFISKSGILSLKSWALKR